jgi:hypothetical protein
VKRLGLLSDRQRLIAALSIVFLAWFSMKFYMDNSNDSETEAYVRAATASATQATIWVDATGHYALLAPYVLWPFAATLEWVTGAYQLRGFAAARLILGGVVYALAYVWYRRIGLGWLTTLVGLMLLSTSVAFAELNHGWELEKLIEPALFLLAALAAWSHRYLILLGVAALAAANRETGVFVPLVVLALMAEAGGGLRSPLSRWPFWVCAVICVAEVIWLHRFDHAPAVVAWDSLNPERLVYVTGGLCLVPLLAAVWAPSASSVVRRLFFVVAPVWVAFVLGTDRLEQGAVLLTLVALVFVPVTLAGVEQQVRQPLKLAAPRM